MRSSITTTIINNLGRFSINYKQLCFVLTDTFIQEQ